MTNGGGAVTLLFGKEPFPTQRRSFFVPWNEVKMKKKVPLFRHGRVSNLFYYPGFEPSNEQ